MAKNKATYIKFTVVMILILLISFIIPSVILINNIPNNLLLSYEDISEISIKNVSCNLHLNDEIEASAHGEGTKTSKAAKLKFKLFNIFNLKTVNIQLADERKAYIGGYPIGLSLKSTGVIVVANAGIETYAGTVVPITDVKEGDIIIKVNGKVVQYVDDVIDGMSSFSKKDRIVEIVVIRNGLEKNLLSNPVLEEITGTFKLGLEVKDFIEGIGTVTYVKPSGHFGCLGHAISSSENNKVIQCLSGVAYKCKLSGFTKGSRGTPGELKGSFSEVSRPIGSLQSNTSYGVFGDFNNEFATQLYDIGSRFSVKMGKAQIYTTINDTPHFYNIDIIKTFSQKDPSEKGMIIRITDKELLATTGGILQGMSGSPIIQNGKIIGAITHVLVSDSAKGYGVFLDFMYEN